MTKDEAIKYLQQIYPNGGHCWLDEQRIEAIGMAVKALKEEPASEDLEEAAKIYATEGDEETGGLYIVEEEVDAFKAGAKWQKEQMMNGSIEVEVKEDAGGYPYIEPHIELYDYDKDAPTAKAGDKVKLIIVKED